MMVKLLRDSIKMKSMYQITYISFNVPIGIILVAQKKGRVIYVSIGNPDSSTDLKNGMFSWIKKKFPGFDIKESDNDDPHNEFLIDVRSQVVEYFEGGRKHFDIPCEMTGTNFQKSIWKEIEKVPYGETISYGELAANAGNPGSARAAGNACGKNPIPLVIPCHRVIASNGKLGGFTGGLEMKMFLLNIESSD